MMKLNKINQLIKKYIKRYDKLNKQANGILDLLNLDYEFKEVDKLYRAKLEQQKPVFIAFNKLFKKREKIHARNK